MTPPLEAGRPPKIFVFVNSQNFIGTNAMAIAEDGRILAGHCSSNVEWARRDMGCTSHCDWQHDKYAEHYPDGYVIVDLLDLEPAALTAHAGLTAAITAAHALDALENPKPGGTPKGGECA